MESTAKVYAQNRLMGWFHRAVVALWFALLWAMWITVIVAVTLAVVRYFPAPDCSGAQCVDSRYRFAE